MPTTDELRLVGVYDADGTLAGELAYVIGHLLGTRSCSLCDITHGGLRRRPVFDQLAAELGIPFELRHRDELDPPRAAVVAESGLPVVLLEESGDRRVLLDDDALRACDGDPEVLFTMIRDALAAPWVDASSPR